MKTIAISGEILGTAWGDLFRGVIAPLQRLNDVSIQVSVKFGPINSLRVPLHVERYVKESAKQLGLEVAVTTDGPRVD